VTSSKPHRLPLLFAILGSLFLLVSGALFNTIPVVYASCSISSFSVSPSSPQPVGTTVNISGSANCGGGVRAMRILVDGGVISEIGAPDISVTWNTGGASPGSHTISVEAAENGDNNWSHTASQSTGYDLVAPAPPQCSITAFNTSPGSPQPPGTTVTVSGSASCSTGVRAIRIKVNGGVISEIGAQDISATWQAPGPGSYTLEVEAAGNGDDNWSHSASQSTGYEIRQVDPGCTVNSIDASPSSPQPPGTTVTISGSGSCANGSVRAMRVRVDGNVIAEIGAPNISASWTAPNSHGTHTFAVEVAGQGDNNWTFAGSASMNYEIAVVDPRCTVTSIDASPSSPQPPGTAVSISGSATCANGGVRAMRIRVNGSIISEIGGPSISASWTAPSSSGSHTFTVEAAGNGDNDWAFAASRSIGYEIRPVNPGCTVNSINASPPSPQPPGTTVTISGRASCSNGSVRAMRIVVDGGIISEIGGPEISASWTAPNNAGTHTFAVEVAGQGDNNWAFADSQSISYEIAARPSQCRIDSITASPSSPQPPGTTVSITGKASCEGSSVRAIRIRVNGNIISELGGPELTADWTTPNAPGTHTIIVEAAAQGDNNWSSSASSSISYETRAIIPQCRVDSVTASPASPQPPGTRVIITGRASCQNTALRAVRIKVDGNTIEELGAQDVTATWTAPSTAGAHTITVEASGEGDNNWTYAASQSIPYMVGSGSDVVDPGCTLTSLTVDPPSPQPPGTNVTIIAKGECDKGARAIRIKVDGNVLDELGAPELRVDWQSPASAGRFRIEAEIAGIRDDQWLYAGRSAVTFVTTSSGSSQSENSHTTGESTSDESGDEELNSLDSGSGTASSVDEPSSSSSDTTDSDTDNGSEAETGQDTSAQSSTPESIPRSADSSWLERLTSVAEDEGVRVLVNAIGTTADLREELEPRWVPAGPISLGAAAVEGVLDGVNCGNALRERSTATTKACRDYALSLSTYSLAGAALLAGPTALGIAALAGVVGGIKLLLDITNR